MSSSFDEFMREMEAEAREAGPEVEAALLESRQRHWIGRRLFERRRELGYTQLKLSALSGINQADISKIEHAEANPTLDTLAALAAPLGLTLALEPLSQAVRARSARPRLSPTADPINGVAAGPRKAGPAGARAATPRAGNTAKASYARKSSAASGAPGSRQAK